MKYKIKANISLEIEVENHKLLHDTDSASFYNTKSNILTGLADKIRSDWFKNKLSDVFLVKPIKIERISVDKIDSAKIILE